MFARSMFRTARISIRGFATAAKAQEARPYYWTSAAFVGVASATYLAFNHNVVSAEWFAKDAPKALNDPNEWIDLPLVSSVQETHNVKRLRFALPTEEHVIGLNIASALLTKYKGPNDEKPTIRPYTPVSEEDAKGYVEFLIKKYPGGPMSEHMHNLEPKQRLQFKGPIPKYQYEPNKHETIGLIAGGTGIAPMYQLIRAVMKNPDDKTKIVLITANIKEEDVLLKREFEELERHNPLRFRAFYVLEQPPEDWPGVGGRVNKDLLKTVLPGPDKNFMAFVCGPPGFYNAVSGPKKSPKDQGELAGILAELGYSKDQVYKF